MAPPPRVSFCATNLNTLDRLPASLEAVEAIGMDLAVPFEVVVADGPSTDGARAFLEERARSNDHFHLVRHEERKRGTGRRLAFEASSGTVIVPFDTSIAYVRLYSGLLKAYLELETDRMLFSEICALSRRSIEQIGGWRDLIGAEDIDLYGPLIERFGVIAWPIALRESQSARMGAYARQMRYVQGSSIRRVIRMYSTQRDQFIGADYHVRDLMALNASRSAGRRAELRVWFTLASIGARFRPLRPRKSKENHYLLLRNATLESLLREDYRTLTWNGPPPQLLLTPDEIGYLARTSSLWPAVERHAPPLYGLK